MLKFEIPSLTPQTLISNMTLGMLHLDSNSSAERHTHGGPFTSFSTTYQAVLY